MSNEEFFETLKEMNDAQLLTIREQINVILKQRKVGVKPVNDGDVVRILAGELAGCSGDVIKMKQTNALVSVGGEVLNIPAKLLEKVEK